MPTAKQTIKHSKTPRSTPFRCPQIMPSHSQPTNIVITIDGLNSFMLGLHGNTTVETPAFDALAASGVSFDFAYSSSYDLSSALKKMFWGSSNQPITATIAGSSKFISDCPIATSQAEIAAFDSVIQAPLKNSQTPASKLSETQAADFFAAATKALQTIEDGDLLWIHFSGLSAIWDAPIAQRQLYQALDDPEPYAQTQPPSFSFNSAEDDPDLLVSVRQACFAQVAVIDRMLGVFFEYLSQHPVEQSSALVVAGSRGYCLGEHNYVGIAQDLYAQSLHIPLLVKRPGDEEDFQNRRSHALVQSSLIGDWITGHHDINDHSSIITDNDSHPLFSKFQNETAVQTAAWKLLRKVDDDGVVSRQLFAKPDDRWEVNDVARRCPQIVEELESLINEAPSA